MALRLRDVTFRYPAAAHAALAGVDLAVHSGDLVLVCGPSGGGKSTLLRLCLGLVPQFSGGDLAGTLSVLGHDPTQTPPRDLAVAGVSYVFQNPAEGFVGQRAGEEVAFGPENLALPAREVDRRVGASLAAVGLAGFEARRLRELSAGQQQRVALAAALAMQPRVLLLDEPTAHLDVTTAREVLALIGGLHQERRFTVLLAEHRLQLATPLASRIVTLAGGRIVSDTAVPAHADSTAGQRGRGGRVGEVLSTSGRPATPAGSEHPVVPPERSIAEGAGQPPLTFTDVSYRYPTTGEGVSGLSFTVHAGEAVALVGPSGAGKTTLGRLALGLLMPDRGRVTVCGLSTKGTPFSCLAAVGGLVLQNPLHQLLAERVDEEVQLGLQHLSGVEARRRTDEVLALLDLDALRTEHPLRLSEGQRRRVALAAVLARRPRLVVMDEPTLGQDEEGCAVLAEVVRTLVQGGGAVLAISHDPDFVAAACARVLVLRGGRLADDAGEGARAGAPLAAAFAGGASAAGTQALRRASGVAEYDRQGRIPAIDPRAQLAWLAAVTLGALFGGAAGLAAGAVFSLAVLQRARVVGRWLRVARVLLPLVVCVAAFDAAAGHTGEGLRSAARLMVLASAGQAFASVADGESMVAALRALHAPYAVTFVLVAGARFVPATAGDLRDVRDAARLRGVALDGGPWRQLAGWRRLLVPLLVGTVRRGLQLGEAMEARAFGVRGQRTVRRTLVWGRRDGIFTVGAGLYLSIVLTVATWVR